MRPTRPSASAHARLMAALLVVGLLGAGEAAPAEAVARGLLARAGLQCGVASVLHAGDGALALALVGSSGLVVQALDGDARRVAALRERADAAGLLARRLYAQRAADGALPYADHLVDLLVVADLDDRALAALPLPELMRVLSPFRGAACLGRAQPLAADGALTKAALAAWAPAGSQVWEDATGVWALLRKPTPAGMEGWTHRHHGADNNPVSDRTVITTPLMTQWMGKPLSEGFFGSIGVGDAGRYFFIWQSGHAPVSQFDLTARSVHNGSVLWRRVFTEKNVSTNKKYTYNYNAARNCIVAAGQALFVIDGDGVLELDAETGAERRRIPGPQPGGQVKCIACAEGRLVVLAGDADVLDANDKLFMSAGLAKNPHGRRLAAIDLASGRELWRQELPEAIDERMLAVRGGRIFGYAMEKEFVALSLADGRTLWRNPDPALMRKGFDKLPPFAIGIGQVRLIAAEQAVIACVSTGRTFALSPETGAKLCELPGGQYQVVKGYAQDGKWWTAQRGIADLLTGSLVGQSVTTPESTQFLENHVSCGPFTGVPGLHIGACGTVKTLADGTVLSRAEVKAECDVGTLVSDGVLLTPPSVCSCVFESKGHRAVASAPGFAAERIPPAAERLASAAGGAPPSGLAVTPADWPMYRANIARTGSTRVQLPATAPTASWTWSPAVPVAFEPSPTWKVNRNRSLRTSPDSEFSPTPPIAAAGRVWFGDAGGIVRCLDAVSGRQLWSFAAAARLLAPPTVADGRLLFGAGDGWVYCLEAVSGRELWRFRAAPFERLLMSYGHLTSTWPVNTGVLVDGGVAYCAAGFQSINGVYVYALEVATGAVVWENRDTARYEGPYGYSGPTGGNGVSGTMTIASGRLWMAGGTDWPVSFDLRTGKADARPIPLRARSGVEYNTGFGPDLRGGEVAAFAGRYIMLGGRRLVMGYDERCTDARFRPGFLFVGVKEGVSQAPGVAFMRMSLPPAWDDEQLVLASKFDGRLAAMASRDVVAYFDRMVAGGATAVAPEEPADNQEQRDPTAAPAAAVKKDERKLYVLPKEPIGKWVEQGRQGTVPALAWGLDAANQVSAMVLTGNAILMAHPVPDDSATVTSAWQLTALERSSGMVLWTVPLPGEPIYNGICVDREGGITTVLRSGGVAHHGR